MKRRTQDGSIAQSVVFLVPSKNFGGDEEEEKENEKSQVGNSFAPALECVVIPSSQ